MEKTNKSTFEGFIPDDMVFQILSKIYDLKTLCICALVSKRFYRLVLQVEAISFTSVIDPILIHPKIKRDVSVCYTLSMPLKLAMLSLKKFKRVKSFNIQLLFPPNNPLLNKWIIKFDNKQNQFLLLSSDYVCHKKDIYDPRYGIHPTDLCNTKYKTAPRCFVDARIIYCRLLQRSIEIFPLLENISITDLGKRWKLSYNGERIIAMRNILTLPYENYKHKHLRRVLTRSYAIRTVGFLKLSISGYVMRQVTLTVRKRDDIYNNLRLLAILDDDFVGGKEEDLYNEAIKKILDRQ